MPRRKYKVTDSYFVSMRQRCIEFCEKNDMSRARFSRLTGIPQTSLFRFMTGMSILDGANNKKAIEFFQSDVGMGIQKVLNVQAIFGEPFSPMVKVPVIKESQNDLRERAIAVIAKRDGKIVARFAGVNYSSLMRFVNQDRNLCYENAVKLDEYLSKRSVIDSVMKTKEA